MYEEKREKANVESSSINFKKPKTKCNYTKHGNKCKDTLIIERYIIIIKITNMKIIINTFIGNVDKIYKIEDRKFT